MFIENKFWMCIRNYCQGELIGFETFIYNELFFKPYLPNKDNRRKVDRSDDKELVSCRFIPALPRSRGILSFEIPFLFFPASHLRKLLFPRQFCL